MKIKDAPVQRKLKPGEIAMIIPAAFILICYLPYIGLMLGNGERLSSCLLPLGILLCAAVPCLYLLFSKRKHGKVIKTLKCIYLFGMYFYMVSFSALFIYITAYAGIDASSAAAAFPKENDSRDIVMVFGCRTYGYTPGRNLRARLNTAYELLCDIPDSVCVVSGGEGENEGASEAESMCRYLVAKGIDRNRIYLEDQSHNTYENIENSLELIKNEIGEYDRLIGVSSDFHIPRIKYLYSYYDTKAYAVPAASPGPLIYFINIVREYLAYAKMLLVTVL